MRRLAVVPALLLAPALASAQIAAPSTRTYLLSGCDYAYANVFGPGPRLCLNGLETVTTYGDSPYAEAITGGFTFNAPTEFLGGSRIGDPGFWIMPTAFDEDGGFISCFVTVCRGTGALGILAGGEVSASYIPVGAGATVRYYVPGTEPPAWDVVDQGLTSTFYLTATLAPEPATLALTLGGLAVLGAGAWRQRRRT